ncbi:adenylosuccinate synthetase [Hymenobacter actinosclerus]|uniref:Adenylosuccinate synthetase n=1 Tax=Hymenobacter actinosclerus TaxID=82805 RepID=A0A1I0DJA6_9BACT|nr:adenylosuccinate synthetase [Hymenobacter actinosclerus]SET32533.1 adenylosuccinate synthase [Hymenobacter actinosclerus]
MSAPQAYIVLGLGYGDEGKGLATDWLCRRLRPGLVVRFNGGAQAGHTVVTAEGKHHVFSSFGAGTLAGVPTLWSAHCPFAPGPALAELAALQQLGVAPQLLVDAACPVTTHYDVLYNRVLESRRGAGRHGSVGVGFGATLARHEAGPAARLTAGQLLKPGALPAALARIRAYYRARLATEAPEFAFDSVAHDTGDDRLLAAADTLAGQHRAGGPVRFGAGAAALATVAARGQAVVFEGAQGILLDMDAGEFPHVTRSHTTSRNALALVRAHLPGYTARIQYVTRAYHTRHGAGPLPGEAPLALRHYEHETNRPHPYQGCFRLAPLYLPSVRHALAADAPHAAGHARHLLITCLDQTPDQHVLCSENEVPGSAAPGQLPALLGVAFDSLQLAYGPTAATVRLG